MALVHLFLFVTTVSLAPVHSFQSFGRRDHEAGLLPKQPDGALGVSTTTEGLTEATATALVVPETDIDSIEIPAPPPPVPIQELPLVQLALAGTLTTFCADLTMHPVDCIKTIQQSDFGVNFSMLQAARYLYEKDGIFGFLHGFLTYACSDGVGGALKFGVWETWKKKTTPRDGTDPAVFIVALGAALAFLAASIIIVPGELLKQQLQMSHYDGLWQAVQGIADPAGDGSFNLRGFFAGYDGVLYRDIPYTILELGLYDTFKRLLSRSTAGDDEESMLNQVLCAVVTGAIVAVATTPMDVIKTKLMVDNYASFSECLLLTVQNHGLGSLFSGVWARVAWVAPFTAIYLPTYDFLKRSLWRRHLDHIKKHGSRKNQMVPIINRQQP